MSRLSQHVAVYKAQQNAGGTGSEDTALKLVATSYAEFVGTVSGVCDGSGAWAEYSRIELSIASLVSPGMVWRT